MHNFEKTYKYPAHLKELIKSIYGNKMIGIPWHDDFKLSMIVNVYDKKSFLKLCAKYNLDKNDNDKYIWEILEKMYNFRPF